MSEAVGNRRRRPARQPEIFDTDEDAQCTSAALTGALQDQGIRINMNGKCCWRDNIFVEGPWWTIKHEEVCPHGYSTVSEPRTGIGRYT